MPLSFIRCVLSCSTCRRPVKSGKSANLISANVHLAAGSAVSGIGESRLTWCDGSRQRQELQLRGLTTNRVASFVGEGRIQHEAKKRRSTTFYYESDRDRIEAVLQPEKGSCERRYHSRCVSNTALNVGCLVGLSCDVIDVDGSSPPRCCRSATDRGQNEKTRYALRKKYRHDGIICHQAPWHRLTIGH
jgi:hypothetical protein